MIFLYFRHEEGPTADPKNVLGAILNMQEVGEFLPNSLDDTLSLSRCQRGGTQRQPADFKSYKFAFRSPGEFLQYLLAKEINICLFLIEHFDNSETKIFF